ncbi:hypothetical protein D9754_16510 [Planomicrobium sp. Y74]|nr:hypothetical protein D9754_16510 [Planomicrobium sp. Y74]
MKKLLNSHWRLSVYALFGSIGAIIGSFLVTQNIYAVWGGLTALVILIAINAIYVLYKKSSHDKVDGANHK